MLNIDNCEEYFTEVRTLATAAGLESQFTALEEALKVEPTLTYVLFRHSKPMCFTARVLNNKREYITTCFIDYVRTKSQWIIKKGNE